MIQRAARRTIRSMAQCTTLVLGAAVASSFTGIGLIIERRSKRLRRVITVPSTGWNY